MYVYSKAVLFIADTATTADRLFISYQNVKEKVHVHLYNLNSLFLENLQK